MLFVMSVWLLGKDQRFYSIDKGHRGKRRVEIIADIYDAVKNRKSRIIS